MNSARRWFPALAAIAFFFGSGCGGKVPLRAPSVAPPAPIPTPNERLEMHLLGTWENTGRNKKTKQMIFSAGGAVHFSGGLEYFNPARWELDPERHELVMTMPQTDDEKLQIFQMYVGDGVKALDRRQQRVTYTFDDQTWSLNVGGWVYSKSETPSGQNQEPAEPIIK